MIFDVLKQNIEAGLITITEEPGPSERMLALKPVTSVNFNVTVDTGKIGIIQAKKLMDNLMTGVKNHTAPIPQTFRNSQPLQPFDATQSRQNTCSFKIAAFAPCTECVQQLRTLATVRERALMH